MTEQQLKDQIKHLVELQKIDSKIYRMKQDVQSIPSQKKTAEEAFQKHKAQLADAEKHYKDKQMRQKELENEVLAKEELIKKYQSQQAQVKTNQEYSALTKEINDATADKSIAEDEVLRIMDEVENEKKVLDDEKARLAGEEKKLKEELKKHDETQQGLQKEIEALNGERKQFMPSVDPDQTPRQPWKATVRTR